MVISWSQVWSSKLINLVSLYSVELALSIEAGTIV